MVTVALATLARPVIARTQINCATTELIIRSTPGGDGSVRIEEYLSFFIDDAAKTLTFSDRRRLRSIGSAQIARIFNTSSAAAMEG